MKFKYPTTEYSGEDWRSTVPFEVLLDAVMEDLKSSVEIPRCRVTKPDNTEALRIFGHLDAKELLEALINGVDNGTVVSNADQIPFILRAPQLPSGVEEML